MPAVDWGTAGVTTSLWHDRDPLRRYCDLDAADEVFDDVVVGAGLTGLTTGLLLARSGRRVVVLEARERGAVTTGRTTAKVSLLQGTKLSRMRRHHSRAARLGVRRGEPRRSGRGCSTSATSTGSRCSADPRSPMRPPPARRRPRVPSTRRRWRRVSPCAGSSASTYRCRTSVARCSTTRLSSTRSTSWRPSPTSCEPTEDCCTRGAASWTSRGTARDVTLDDGRTLRAGTVVLATGTPFLDRGSRSRSSEPHRSYVVVARGAADAGGDVPVRRLARPVPAFRRTRVTRHCSWRVDRATSWDAAARSNGGSQISGLGRPRTTPTRRRRTRGPRRTTAPRTGSRTSGRCREVVAASTSPTGFDKWGMANAVAAGLSITSEILDGELLPWAARCATGSPDPARRRDSPGSTPGSGWLRAEPSPASGAGPCARTSAACCDATTQKARGTAPSTAHASPRTARSWKARPRGRCAWRRRASAVETHGRRGPAVDEVQRRVGDRLDRRVVGGDERGHALPATSCAQQLHDRARRSRSRAGRWARRRSAAAARWPAPGRSRRAAAGRRTARTGRCRRVRAEADQLEQLATRGSRSAGRPGRSRSGTPTFSAAVRIGTSPKDWKTNADRCRAAARPGRARRAR